MRKKNPQPMGLTAVKSGSIFTATIVQSFLGIHLEGQHCFCSALPRLDKEQFLSQHALTQQCKS